MPAHHLRPSPVDALSLRKARERVEKRLREQQGKRIQDNRHVRTLELAKQLASEELRKRQEEWKKSNAGAEEAAAPETDGEPQAVAPDTEPFLADAPAPDQTPGTDQAADEMMTASALEEPADSPEPIDSPEPVNLLEPVAENAAEPEDDGDAVAAGNSPEDPQSEPHDEAETGLAEASEAATGEEILPASASLSTDPEAEGPESRNDMPAANVAAAVLSRTPGSGWGGGLARLLPVVAWLILSAGVIGAVLSWTTISEVQASARFPMAEGLGGSLPLGLLLGFAYLATGVLGFAFFWVSSLISAQLRDIYRVLQTADRDQNMLQDKAA
jgi:hypothetical protein